MITESCYPIFPDIVAKRNHYQSYISEITNNQQDVICIDIGFSGTTQKLLTSLFNLNTEGYYLFLSEKFNHSKIENCNANGFWEEKGEFGQGNPLVDYSLVTESLFTSPEGQLLDINQDQKYFNFKYGKKTNIQKYFFYTYPVIQGIDDFINEMYIGGISKQQIASLINIHEAFKLQLCYDSSPEISLLKYYVEVDDTISGFGIINPFSFLPGLMK